MDNAVVILTSVAAMNVDSYNRSFKADKDIQNGAVFKCGTLSTDEGESEVFMAETAAASDKGLYMAFTAEDTIITIAGQQYKFGLIDPRLYTNVAGLVFSGFRLVPGDRITIAGGVKGNPAAYVAVGTDGALEYTATEPTDGLGFKAIQNTYISAAGVGKGVIGGSQRLDAVELEVIAN